MAKPAGSKREDLFALEYPKDLNATAAAIRAGYSKKTAAQIGYKLVQKRSVQAKMQAALDARAKRTNIDADYVLTGIREVVERCMQKVEVLDEHGQPTGEWRFEPNPTLKGFELLGKNLKLFTDVTEHRFGEGLADALKEARARRDARR